MSIHILFVLAGLLAGIWLGKASMKEGDDIFTLCIPIAFLAGFVWLGIDDFGQALGDLFGGSKPYPFGMVVWDGLVLLWLCGLVALITRAVIARRRNKKAPK